MNNFMLLQQAMKSALGDLRAAGEVWKANGLWHVQAPLGYRVAFFRKMHAMCMRDSIVKGKLS